MTQISAGFGSRIVIGTPSRIVDEMEAWVDAGAADGFNICPAVLPLGMEEFAAMVVPEMQRRGLFRTDYAGQSLRDHLGIPLPASRYAR